MSMLALFFSFADFQFRKFLNCFYLQINQKKYLYFSFILLQIKKIVVLLWIFLSCVQAGERKLE
jgi:hypothetical protein